MQLHSQITIGVGEYVTYATTFTNNYWGGEYATYATTFTNNYWGGDVRVVGRDTCTHISMLR